jgi:hypothetical protein
MGIDRAHADPVKALGEAEPPQDADGIRAHIDAATDLVQFRSLLVDIDRKSAPRNDSAAVSPPMPAPITAMRSGVLDIGRYIRREAAGRSNNRPAADQLARRIGTDIQKLLLMTN